MTAPPAGSGQLAHNVYFTLHDRSDAAVERLLSAIHELLSGHEGTLFFAAGRLVPDLKRPVNDLEFDVSLHVVFADRAAHDRYQVHPRHERFIAENRAGWAKVRVFDSYV